MNWNNTKDALPEVNQTVIGYNKEWTHEDFNPNGFRECFYTDEENWIMSKWNGYQDQWTTWESDEKYIDGESVYAPSKWFDLSLLKNLPNFKDHV